MNYTFAFFKISFYLCALIFIHLNNMKKLVLFTLLSVALISCSGNKKQQVETTFELDNLMLVAEEKVNDTIAVVGYVTHTCKESGKRCFIVSESQEISLRVEAGGEISVFDAELVGSKLEITGILKEQKRLSLGDIAEMEKGVQERIEGGESEESCASEKSNIEDMRKWMEAHNRDQYVIYYMDGLSFKKLEQK